jgi:hypothetical protein
MGWHYVGFYLLYPIFNTHILMKRAFSIFFLVLFLFNVGGYYFVYWALQSRAKKDLVQRLDVDNFPTSDLIIISVPMSLPYPLQQQSGYERVDGEFEYQGEYYRLVKQRLENDTLYMVCIKDQGKKKLVKVLNEYSTFANNLPQGANHTLDMFAKLFKDYTPNTLTQVSAGNGWSLDIPFAEIQITLFNLERPVNSPPPRA